VSGAGVAAGRCGRVGAGWHCAELSAGDSWLGRVEGRHSACGSGRWGARWQCVGPCVRTGRTPMDLLPDPAPLATRLQNTLLRYHSIADSEWRIARKTVSGAAAPPVSASRCRSRGCHSCALTSRFSCLVGLMSSIFIFYNNIFGRSYMLFSLVSIGKRQRVPNMT